MRANAASTARRLLPVGILVVGWLAGFVIHGSSAAATGWGDVSDPLMLLGAALCLVAGGVAWAVAPAHRRARYGVLAGILMFVSFVIGNMIVAALWVWPEHGGESGETWFSLLLESWFWIGLPTLVSGSLGAVGWLMARQWETVSSRHRTA
jgi:hypothetical protein